MLAQVIDPAAVMNYAVCILFIIVSQTIFHYHHGNLIAGINLIEWIL